MSQENHAEIVVSILQEAWRSARRSELTTLEIASSPLNIKPSPPPFSWRGGLAAKRALPMYHIPFGTVSFVLAALEREQVIAARHGVDKGGKETIYWRVGPNRPPSSGQEDHHGRHLQPAY